MLFGRGSYDPFRVNDGEAARELGCGLDIDPSYLETPPSFKPHSLPRLHNDLIHVSAIPIRCHPSRLTGFYLTPSLALVEFQKEGSIR